MSVCLLFSVFFSVFIMFNVACDGRCFELSIRQKKCRFHLFRKRMNE